METRDKEGNFCPFADNEMKIIVEGAGELIAVDNGNQTSLKSFKSNKVKLFSGKAVCIVRSIKNIDGKIVVNISSDGMEDVEILITTGK